MKHELSVESFFLDLKQNKCFEGSLLFNEPLAKHTYYKIGGPADCLAIPKNLSDLRLLTHVIQEINLPFFILGRGSNLLVSDQGFKGLIIKATEISPHIGPVQNSEVQIGGSVLVSALLARGGEQGWDGIEFLAGIPGSVGGLIQMNAGTPAMEVKNFVHEVEVFDFENGQVLNMQDLNFSYRKNHFLKKSQLVLNSLWKLHCGDPQQVKKKISETLKHRKSTQPYHLPSCGSVFMNPQGQQQTSFHSAWKVIEALGLKGYRIGNAMFSELHANFILNCGQAKASDVLALINLAQKRALDELGVQLHLEVQKLGFDSGVSS